MNVIKKHKQRLDVDQRELLEGWWVMEKWIAAVFKIEKTMIASLSRKYYQKK